MFYCFGGASRKTWPKCDPATRDEFGRRLVTRLKLATTVVVKFAQLRFVSLRKECQDLMKNVKEVVVNIYLSKTLRPRLNDIAFAVLEPRCF